MAAVCFPWENSLDAEDGLSGEAPPLNTPAPKPLVSLFRFVLVSVSFLFGSFLLGFVLVWQRIE